MPRTLITGGAGFLGSHLCDSLLERGHEVICMDNFITGSRDNIRHIKSDRFQLIERNVTQYIEGEDLVEKQIRFLVDLSPKTFKLGAIRISILNA